MELVAQNIRGRVRANTPEEKNLKIDWQTKKHIRKFGNLTPSQITLRIEELNKEWDIERTLEVNASALAITGLFLGTFLNRKWYILTVVVSGFLLRHGLQGWCPPLPFLRSLGVRTRQEIDEEIFALKVLRGDFNSVTPLSEPDEIMQSFRK